MTPITPAITTIPAVNETAGLLRVAAYCRVSSDSADQEHSYAAQVKYYTEYIGETRIGSSWIFTPTRV